MAIPCAAECNAHAQVNASWENPDNVASRLPRGPAGRAMAVPKRGDFAAEPEASRSYAAEASAMETMANGRV